jgi:uncharacterized protein YecE (DUF72 family)
MIRVGTAGWSIGRDFLGEFPPEGTHLERYCQVLNSCEINSTFHRSHRPATYAKWAATVPDDFQFSVKLSKEITHKRKLVECGELLRAFLDETSGLGEKRAVVLVQLPPKLAFDAALVGGFFQELRGLYSGLLVCEPRHPSWFGDEGDAMLASFEVARVAADPAIVPAAAEPGGWRGLDYWRLHGFPRVYYSAYGSEFVQELAGRLGDPGWCIFDNTAWGAGTGDALQLRGALG